MPWRCQQGCLGAPGPTPCGPVGVYSYLHSTCHHMQEGLHDAINVASGDSSPGGHYLGCHACPCRLSPCNMWLSPPSIMPVFAQPSV